jgi:hypothetical protein
MKKHDKMKLTVNEQFFFFTINGPTPSLYMVLLRVTAMAPNVLP